MRISNVAGAGRRYAYFTARSTGPARRDPFKGDLAPQRDVLCLVDDALRPLAEDD
jgi:hypothetical protein